MQKGLAAVSETVSTILIVLFFAFVIRAFIFQPFVVEGSSMVPTFHDHNYLIVNKFVYRFATPKRGDVIVFQSPTIRNTDFIKRVIGLPGDVVRVEKDQVFVNGKKIDEPYINHETDGSSALQPASLERFLSSTQYWVMGDNRNHSSDSRDWGPLESTAIIGQATITVFPTQDFGLVQAPSYSF